MTNERAVHLHFGAGKLGLGLVLPYFSRNSDLPVVAAIRTSSTADHNEALRSAGRFLRHAGSSPPEEFTAPEILRYDEATLGTELERRSWIPEVITTSAKEGLPSVIRVVPSLVRRFKAHYRTRPLFFLPFENAPSAGEDCRAHLLGELGAADAMLLYAFNGLCDKICPEIQVRDIDGVPVACVVTESHEEFYFTSLTPLTPPAKQRLKTLHLEKLILDERAFAFHVRKKMWLLNGLHYFLALQAFETGFQCTTIADLIAGQKLDAPIQAFLEEMVYATAHFAHSQSVKVDSKGLEVYAGRCLERILNRAEHKFDSITPLLTTLSLELPSLIGGTRNLRPGLADFYSKWHLRIVEPSEIVLRNHGHFKRPLILPRLTSILLRALATVLDPLLANTYNKNSNL